MAERGVVNKLVRDRIPGKIRAAGEVPVYRTLTPFECMNHLRTKLVEESQELSRTQNRSTFVKEAADVLEVFEAMLKAWHFSIEEVRRAQAKKRAAVGGFEEGIFLERILPAAKSGG